METCRPQASETPTAASAGDARVSVVGAPTRCPACALAVRPREETWTACAACLTRHHASCWRARGACGACGDPTPLVPRRRAREAEVAVPIPPAEPAAASPAAPATATREPDLGLPRAGLIALFLGAPIVTGLIVLTIQLASGASGVVGSVATGVAAALAGVTIDLAFCVTAAVFLKATSDAALVFPEETPALGLWLPARGDDEPAREAAPEETAQRLRDRIETLRRERAGGVA